MRKKSYWLKAPNILEVAREGYNLTFSSRYAQLKKARKAGKCYSFPKLFHLNMVKRVTLKDYIWHDTNKHFNWEANLPEYEN